MMFAYDIIIWSRKHTDFGNVKVVKMFSSIAIMQNSPQTLCNIFFFFLSDFMFI